MKETILDSPSKLSSQVDTSIEYPPMPTRVEAFIVDNVVILILMVAISSLLESTGEVHSSVKIILFAAILCYEPLLTAFGATLGQLLLGIRVRNIKNTNEKINLGFAFLRFVVKCTLGVISLIMMSFSE
jgi:uncharacterized RDD family membrane protein YckC